MMIILAAIVGEKLYRLHADIVMSLEDIFGKSRRKLDGFGKRLDRGMGNREEWSYKFLG